ncbi:MAG: CHRD domain-containing protein [Deltaproteobacteria bacterium]
MIYYKNINAIIITGGIFIFATVCLMSEICHYGYAYAQGKPDFIATLSGKEVVPPVKTAATGIADFIVLDNSVNYQINVLDAGKITSIQIHNGTMGINGDVIVTLYNKIKDNGTNLIQEKMSKFSDISSTIQRSSSASGNFQASDLTGPLAGKTINDLVLAMQNDETYVNVHTEDQPEGELRGQILERTG